MDMDLLKHHIEETRSRFDEVRSDLQEIRAKLEDIKEFKIDAIATSRTVSFIVSAISGLITLVATALTIKK